MQIPFFSEEDNLTAFKKMRIIFLVQKIRMADISLLITVVVPFILNLVILHICRGANEIWKLFCPFGSIFKSSSSIALSDWGTWYGSIHLCILIASISARIYLSTVLWKKMKNYQQVNRGFYWKKNNKCWFMLFFPFISFVIYPILLKVAKFELTHKYNL